MTWHRETYIRWVKFCSVGGIGIGVQLAVLIILTRFGLNYLLATGAAVEAAVLHNFLWHRHFTWIDRPEFSRRQTAHRLMRFHLSNGAISLIGNVLLMRWLVGSLKIPVLPANLVTIASCSLANFLASDRWVFLPEIWPAVEDEASNVSAP